MFIKAPPNPFTTLLPTVLDSYVQIRTGQSIEVEQERVERKTIDTLQAGGVGDSYSSKIITVIKTRRLQRVSGDPSILQSLRQQRETTPKQSATQLYSPQDYAKQHGDAPRHNEPKRRVMKTTLRHYRAESDRAGYTESANVLLITNISNRKVPIFISEQTNPKSSLLKYTNGYVGTKPGSTLEVERSRVNYSQIDILVNRGMLRVTRKVREF